MIMARSVILASAVSAGPGEGRGGVAVAVIVSPSDSARRAPALSVSSRRYGSAMRQPLRCWGRRGFSTRPAGYRTGTRL